MKSQIKNQKLKVKDKTKEQKLFSRFRIPESGPDDDLQRPKHVL